MKVNNNPAAKINPPSEIGKKAFQPKYINWSYLYRGKEARTQIKENKKNTNFIPKIKEKILLLGNQPPKNNMTIKLLINIIFAYSPMKNKAKPAAAYSTL